MDIFWVVAICLFIYWLYSKSIQVGGKTRPASVEEIEWQVYDIKNSLFKLEHIDSPHFIDCQNAYDAMEINYLRIKQRAIHSPEKSLEMALDWMRYVEALRELKSARVMLDFDWTDNAFDHLMENSKEPHIIKEEITKKFKSVLGKDWLKIPQDYFERMEKMKKPSEKVKKELGFDEWQYYYWGEKNLDNMLELRKIKEEAKEKVETDKKQEEA